MKKLYVGYTQYQLLIFLLLKKPEDDIIFLLPKYLESLKERLNFKYKVEIIKLSKPSLKKIFKFIKYYYYIKKLIKKLKISEDTILYGDNIINYILPNNHKLCRLEDGTGNYITKAHEENVSIKKRIYFYIDSIIYLIIFKKKLLKEKEKIKQRIDIYYITEIAPKNLWFEDKTIRINLKTLWNNKNNNEKKEILSIFNLNIDNLKELKEKEVILFTQPLSEDGIISEKEKVELYRKILEKYPKNKIVIKPHPREKTKYDKIYSDYIILKGSYPSELLSLENIYFKKVVTLFSTAGLNYGNKVEIDFYGTEVHPKLYEKFGSCDSIMKRNAFL